ncbi:MAG: HU family DNA-binding protein [Erysipelotrichaceae bacterium]|nr:HU family DNA-binding protein [Erysipelotrichaceae bacterium]
MKKDDIVNALSQKQEKLSKAQAKEIVNEVFDFISQAVCQGDTVDVYGFGKFYSSDVAARKGINPATKEEIEIPASKSVRFKASKAFKDAVKESI